MYGAIIPCITVKGKRLFVANFSIEKIGGTVPEDLQFQKRASNRSKKSRWLV